MWQRHELVLGYQRIWRSLPARALRLLDGRKWHCGLGLRVAFANAYSDSNSYAHTNAYTHSNSYPDLNGHSYRYCYTDAYFHTETNPDAKRYGFAKAAAYSTAAALMRSDR